ncbi:hypothetical protein C7K70_10960 [Aeromonas hydrophila]|nr:hypothetical protein C7K70_10960 [Aeromonas hydrophila]
MNTNIVIHFKIRLIHLHQHKLHGGIMKSISVENWIEDGIITNASFSMFPLSYIVRIFDPIYPLSGAIFSSPMIRPQLKAINEGFLWIILLITFSFPLIHSFNHCVIQFCIFMMWEQFVV